MKVFISYRREDTPVTLAVFDSLQSHFGADNVFMDLSDIDSGQNFVDVIDQRSAERRPVPSSEAVADLLDSRQDASNAQGLCANRDCVALEHACRDPVLVQAQACRSHRPCPSRSSRSSHDAHDLSDEAGATTSAA